MILNLNFETATQQPFWQSPVFGILLTAFFGWCFYRLKQLESRVKQEAENYFLIFNFIAKNHETFHATWLNTLEVLKEIDLFLEALDTLDEIYDNSNTMNQTDKKNYLDSNLPQIQSKLILKETYIEIFNFLMEKDWQKEALFMLLNGSPYFQKIICSLEQEYKMANKNIGKINSLIQGMNQNQACKSFLFNFSDTDFKSKTELTRQEIIYIKNLYISLDLITEYGLFWGYIALEHLSDFNALFAKKYIEILRSFHIVFMNYKIDKQLVEIEDLKAISKETKKSYAPYQEK